MADEQPTIRSLRARAVDVPMRKPLTTAGGSVSSAPLVLIDLETDAGVTGSAYVFCYAGFALAPMVGLLDELGGMIAGEALAPERLFDGMETRFRLLGLQGFAMMAASVIDMAAWDALAKHRGEPLVRLLGGEPLAIPAYNSKGLGLIGVQRAPDEARELVGEGFDAIKLRLGYANAAEDFAVARAVRKAVGDDVQIMTDYNQCLDVEEAGARAKLLGGEGFAWIEEPVRCDDYAGCARVREASTAPIQLGENCWGVHDMEKALDAGSGDYFMPDAGRIGGVTGWRRAAALAKTRELPISSHLYPEISAHLLAATPTRHWLEYVDWASPVLSNPVAITNGHACATQAPGTGIEWDEDAVARCLVQG